MSEDRFMELPSGIRLCYRDEGEGDPIVLIIGLGYQLIHWPEALIAALRESGRRVIRFDNRDSGRSSRIGGPEPSFWQKLRGKAPEGGYDLGDMATDTAGLMDHLGIDRAHVAGMSMGGMIGQVLAARHPKRIKSLTSIFSTTGARNVGQPSLRVMLQFAKSAPKTREEYIERNLQMLGLIGGPGFPSDPAVNREIFGMAWDRGAPDLHHATSRQIGAIYGSGDRTAEVKTISAPTLVIHGDSDPLVKPSGGEATAQAIPGARHVVVPGMGHEISPALSPHLAELILEHTQGHPA
ncbi:alpha/beta fold hydrolase [Halomonas sp. WWR20]